MVEPQSSKLMVRVRFPSSPLLFIAPPRWVADNSHDLEHDARLFACEMSGTVRVARHRAGRGVLSRGRVGVSYSSAGAGSGSISTGSLSTSIGSGSAMTPSTSETTLFHQPSGCG